MITENDGLLIEIPSERISDIKMRVTLVEKGKAAFACISEIGVIRKMISVEKITDYPGSPLNKGDVISYEGIDYTVIDININIFSDTVDLEKFGINKCGAGKESPFNLQLLLVVEKNLKLS